MQSAFILKGIKEYTIIDIGINEFRSLVNFIGTNKTDELLKYLVRELGKEAEIIFNIYCRVGDSRFLLFVPENNDLINILFKNTWLLLIILLKYLCCSMQPHKKGYKCECYLNGVS